ncbi:MAG TPA: aminotransferase class V-fold PLP-dependent enzyme [Vicinamibacterales bacterium]
MTRTCGLIGASALDWRTVAIHGDDPNPVREEFPLAAGRTYLNNASVHPMSLSTRRAVQAYLEARTTGSPETGTPDPRVPVARVKSLFASLIGAREVDIALVPSTTVGENLVVSGLGIPGIQGNIVTDALHFEGSLYHYQSLQRKGLDVRMVVPRGGRIDLNDMERVIDRQTKLVAVSLVSWINGFTHDVKALCEIAHAHGALVYADVIQAAGARPIDVVALDVDFCASASYKWLMGDFGAGFLYVKDKHLGSALARTQYGFRQLEEFATHFLPGDPPGDGPISWTQRGGAAGHFEVGTWASAAITALGNSLEFLQRVGVDRISAHNRALAMRIQRELPRLGFAPLTPDESVGSIVSFAVKDREDTARRLTRAKVDVSLGAHRMRISPSIYSNDQDVDALIAALA